MKYVQEFRDPHQAQHYQRAIARIVTRPWTLMEICGGQTHAIVKFGIDQLLPPEVTLIHGPGCPVCVTPIEIIDQAIALAQLPQVIFTSFGDMARVPGSDWDLLTVKARGGDVRLVYSPLDALKLAQEHPDREVVFFSVGFETTAPATAMAAYQAKQLGLKNFSLLVSHVLVPPAIAAILESPQCQVQGFLAAGHVCTVMGSGQYETLAQKYGMPMVVTGFEPVDILQGIYLCVQQLEAGEARCENQYRRSVKAEGNRHAQALIEKVFQVVPRTWRGLGEIAHSGWGLRPEYGPWDAAQKFAADLPGSRPQRENICLSGEIMQGWKKPHQCPAFGDRCTPEHPLGAPMVSSEGACAAYYRYRRHDLAVTAEAPGTEKIPNS